MITIYFKSEVPALGESIRSVDTADEIEQRWKAAAANSRPCIRVLGTAGRETLIPVNLIGAVQEVQAR